MSSKMTVTTESISPATGGEAAPSLGGPRMSFGEAEAAEAEEAEETEEAEEAEEAVMDAEALPAPPNRWNRSVARQRNVSTT